MGDEFVEPDWLQAKLAKYSSTATGQIEPYRHDPVGFARDVCKLQTWSRMEELMLAVWEEDRTACRAGQKVSKTTGVVAVGQLWAALGGRTILTAPTGGQVKEVLWYELGLQYRHSRPILAGPKKLPKNPWTGLRLPGGGQILGISTDQPNRLAGFSGPRNLWIIDEGPGFPDELFEVILGNAMGGSKIAALGNPNRRTGWFADAFRNGDWRRLHISAEESPNFIARRKVIPGLATYEAIMALRAKCGRDYRRHPLYRVRVLGEFPETDTNTMIDPTAIDNAFGRHRKHDGFVFGRLQIGLDPKRYGSDECVIQPVRGAYAYDPRVLVGPLRGPEIAEQTVQVIRRHRRPTDGLVPVVVDGIAVGAAAVDALLGHPAFGREFTVVELDVSMSATVEGYRNLRSQLWDIDLPKWLETGMLPESQELREELLAATYKFDHKQRIVMDPKDETRKKLKRSPNRADALVMAVYDTPEVAGGYENELPEDEDDDAERAW